MEIQQQEKESLTVYVHQFKTQSRRCNFRNDAATILISIKGLKNAHSLTTHIYEKDPQTLNNAISEVEKLNAVQQLTATITPPSMVNMMSNDEDHCFQCQEHGHIARNCPNIRCFECDEYGLIVMDCPHRISPSATPAKHHQSKPKNTTTPGQAPDTTAKAGTGEAVPDLSHISTDITAQVSMIHIEAIPDHDIGIITTITEVAHNVSSSTYRSYSHQSPHDTPHQPHCRLSVHRSSSYHSRD